MSASPLRIVVALAAVLGAENAAAQIITENAGVLSPETPELQETLSYMRSENGHEWVASQDVIVGVDRSNELRLSVPMAWRDFSTSGTDVETFGIGDATLRWKRALLRNDDVMESTRWSLLASVTAPTGDSASSEAGVEIPPDVRSSRGDWTLGIGTAFTYIVNRHRVASELMARHRTSHDGFQLGGSVDLNLAYWYRITPASFVDIENTTEVRGVLEVPTSYRWNSHENGVSADDGGVLAWVAPGVQVFPTDWCLFQASVQLPFAQTIDDTWGDREFAAIFSVKFLF